jgi:hypothetical protein
MAYTSAQSFHNQLCDESKQGEMRRGRQKKGCLNFLFLSLQEKQKPIYRTSTNGLEKILTPLGVCIYSASGGEKTHFFDNV